MAQAIHAMDETPQCSFGGRSVPSVADRIDTEVKTIISHVMVIIGQLFVITNSDHNVS